MKTGKVYLIGAGPGNPDLITVRGLEILRQADVVIYDYLVDKHLLEEVKKGAELICCDQLGKRMHSNGFLKSQEKINDLIIKKVREEKGVVRLKNGDPSIFSRISQELDILNRNKIEFEIVPGVTAASAAACFTGIPLTDRRFSSSVVFVTGHEAVSKKEGFVDWKCISNYETIVLYMGVKNIDNIANKLISAGRSEDTPVVLVSYAGTINQKILKGRLNNIAKLVERKGIKPPAIFIIGQVADFEKRFNWLGKNKRILFTGLSKERFFIKGTYIHLPLIKIEPISSYVEFDAYLKNIKEFDWIVFTSRYGVKYFFERLKINRIDSRNLKGIQIAVIGSSTRDGLLEFGIIADIVPKKETVAGLLEEFKKINLKNKRIFLPRSDISDKGITEGLTKMSACVTASVAYRNVMPGNLPDLDLKQFDEIIFCSPAGVRNFVKRFGAIPKKVSCIGEVTKKEVRRLYGLRKG